MENKFKSHYERVVGGRSEEETKKAKELLQIRLEVTDDLVKEYELEKTDEDKKLIKLAEDSADKIVLSYGGKPNPASIEKIHLLRPGSTSSITKERLSSAAHSALGQNIIVDRGTSNLGVTLNTIHEFLHLKSYKAAQILDANKNELGAYRSGITIISHKKDKSYFIDIEEAIIAKLTDQVYNEKLKNNLLFKKEIETTEKFKELFEKTPHYNNFTNKQKKVFSKELYSIPGIIEAINTIESGELKDRPMDFKLGYIAGIFSKICKENSEIVLSAREKEREDLDNIIDDIYEKSKRTMSKKEIFDEFAKANFSGNLLPLARMVENTLGKGYFRKIAEKFSK
ncbi:MAG: hypothetical protein PHN74_00975 [Candidatus Pacebacteria bacterium]|nr:hypothetical protein [Candidatus Paceibacterota bacterium]